MQVSIAVHTQDNQVFAYASTHKMALEIIKMLEKNNIVAWIEYVDTETKA